MIFTRDSNYRELLEILVFLIDRRLREMVAHVRWPHIEVQLSSFKCTGHLNEGDLETLYLNAGVGLSRCICCGSILSLVQIFFPFVFGYGNV